MQCSSALCEVFTTLLSLSGQPSTESTDEVWLQPLLNAQSASVDFMPPAEVTGVPTMEGSSGLQPSGAPLLDSSQTAGSLTTANSVTGDLLSSAHRASCWPLLLLTEGMLLSVLD
jgi:hypothetical protein